MRALIITAAVLALSATGFSQEPKKQIKKVPAEYTNPVSGEDMFRSYCAACHGADGKGTGPAASALKKAPSDLTLLNRNHDGKFPGLLVQRTIKGDAETAAHGSREMPMWGDIFRSVSPGQSVVELRVRSLTDYIQGMQQK